MVILFLLLLLDDILYTVLDLYLSKGGSLPSTDEVLLCTDNVTVEQVYKSLP